jgi:hypothetical protein
MNERPPADVGRALPLGPGQVDPPPNTPHCVDVHDDRDGMAVAVEDHRLAGCENGP